MTVAQSLVIRKERPRGGFYEVGPFYLVDRYNACILYYHMRTLRQARAVRAQFIAEARAAGVSS